MKIQNPLALAMMATFALAVVGCHKQGDANTEMEKAVKALEQSNPAPAPAPVATPVQVAGAPAPVAQPAQQPVTSQPVAQQMSQALAAYKSGDYLDAVTRLQLLRTSVAKTPEQTMAIQDAMAAVMTELYARAEKGDTRAKQAIKEFQEIRKKTY